MIRSKLSLDASFFILLLSGFVVLGLVFLSHPRWQFRNKLGGTNSAIIPGVILVLLMGGILVFLLRRMGLVSIGHDKLYLLSLRGKRTVEHAQIASIDLWGRTGSNGAPSDIIRVELKDGEKIELNGGAYRNLPELKRALEAEFPDLLTAAPENRVQPDLKTDPRVFSGPVLPSFKGILFYGLLLFGIIMCITSLVAILISAVIIAPALVIFGVQLCYFRLTAETLEIRNHVAPWYQKSYPLIDIAGVVLESSHNNWSRTMRVLTYDHHNDGYPAGTLRKRDWQALARALKKRGIHVNTQDLGTKTSS